MNRGFCAGRVLLALGLGLGTLVPHSASAATVLLQTVDLTDRGLSTEGGEAKLFRLTGSTLGRCKIEAVHYGEMGRTTLRFIFDSRLRYAAMREFHYSRPLPTVRNPRMRLMREVLLTSAEGARTLPGDWATYKGYFQARQLQRCQGQISR